MPTRSGFVFLVLFVAAVAFASGIPKKRANVATTAASYCSAYLGQQVSFQCEYPVYLTTGRALTDGGTRRTTDAGAPMTPNPLGDELYSFPGDPAKVTLGSAENCFALLSQDAGDGGNQCNFAEQNAP